MRKGRSRRYVIGIDLGTTNSAVAYVDLAEKKSADASHRIQFFEIPQLVAPGELAPEPVLPSFLYLPGTYDLPEGSATLPWDETRDYIVGTFAREQGAKVPGRVVGSAKSWLCHAGVNRTASILPWGASPGVPKVSPVDAAQRYLQHLREAWNHRIAQGRPAHRFEDQLVILTVPASFDEIARELTIQAANDAGLTNAILLEEPLAACYAWLHDHTDTWPDQMQDGQLILVCDIGGGTTDFSVIAATDGEAGLQFDRLAVGDHLLLGGDNMDLTLARHIEIQLMGRPGKLKADRWHQLVHQCRKAKETLLNTPDAEASADITLIGSAGQLIGGTLKAQLAQAEVQNLIVDGFFPSVEADAKPDATLRSGLTELGLPYVQDPAITRHLADFWQRFAPILCEATDRSAPYPDYLLFNGGTLTPEVLQQRLVQNVSSWFQKEAGADWTPSILSNPRLDLAVAQGAAYYGLVRLGDGIRIGSGSPRSYYVGVGGTEGPAQTAVCLMPRGLEEGAEVQLQKPDFEARTNQPVTFELFSSIIRTGDALGDVVELDPDETTALPPIQTVLRYGKKGVATQLPVQLAVRLTEIGTLEVWCESKNSDHRWQLHFDVRQEADTASTGGLSATLDEARIETAQAIIQETFVTDTRHPDQLRKAIEAALELPRAEWPVALIRKLADTLLEVPRGRSPQHEARWLNTLGYCLRPGYGDAVDDWRMAQVWKLYLEGLKYPKQTQCKLEWWIFWRRVAGGLPAEKQSQIYHEVRRVLQPQQRSRSKKDARRGPSQELREIWMALANFERLEATDKANLGRQLLQQMRRSRPRPQELWALSRLGTRHPMYGPMNTVVDRNEVAGWVKTMLTMHTDHKTSKAHTLVHLARYTGDRARDLPEQERNRVARWLRKLPEGNHYRDLLLNPDHLLDQKEQNWVFGETLPIGLVLSDG